MNTSDGIYRVIYEYFESRILFGVYKYGEYLPSVPKTMGFFHTCPTAVRSALELLDRKGYIKMTGQKSARVLYVSDADKIRERALEYFTLREQGIIDMVRSAPLLMGPLWREGIRQGSQQDWDRIQGVLAVPSPGAIWVIVGLYSMILGVLNNKLVLNLFWEEIRYLRFPYLTEDRLEIQENQRKAVSRDEMTEVLRQIFSHSYGEMIRELTCFIRTKSSEAAFKGGSPIPFQWNTYRRRPQLKYTLASRLIWEIVNGQYPAGSYLPSYPQITRRYNVSAATVRRTMNLLSEMGVVQSFHGKGTLVIMRTAKMNFKMPEVREGMNLYLDSLQILTLTIRNITLYTLKEASEEGQRCLTRSFERIRREKMGHLCFDLYFHWIKEYCPLAAVRECYRRLYEFLIWGYPFLLYRIRYPKLHERYRDFVEEAAGLLEQGRTEDFSEAWELLMGQEEREAREFMPDLLS